MISDRGYGAFEDRCDLGEIPVGSRIEVRDGGYTHIYTLQKDGARYELVSPKGAAFDLFEALGSLDWSVMEETQNVPVLTPLGPNDVPVRLAVKGDGVRYFADIGSGHTYDGDLTTVARDLASYPVPAGGMLVVRPGSARVKGRQGLQEIKNTRPAGQSEAEELQRLIQEAIIERAEELRRRAEAGTRVREKPKIRVW